MANVELTHPPVPVLRRGKSLGLGELTTLLGHLPSAGLILDRARATVAVANSALARLTGFSVADLTGALVTDLIPDLPLERLPVAGDLTLSLCRGKREPIEVMAQISPLDNQDIWLLVTLTGLEEYRDNLAHKREGDVRRLLDLARLPDEPDLERAFARVVAFSREIFETDSVCIYQAEGEQPRLSLVSCCQPENQVFPAVIPSTDLIRLAGVTVWSAGKRVQAEIHRRARAAGLSYLASAPLGEGKGLFGLLVVGGLAREPTSWMIGLLEVIAAHVSVAIQHFTLSENLRREVERFQKLSLMHSAVIANSSEGILLLTPDLTVIEINPAAEWMLRYDNLEVYGLPVDHILIGSERIRPSLEAARQGQMTHGLVNVPLHRRTGAPFTAGIQALPVKDGGQVQAVIVFLTDTSLQEQYKVRTQQLEQRASLGDISAVFAHEVRNPINNISTGLQLILSRLPSSDPNYEVIHRMENDCTRLDHLMNSVLAFSRPLEPRLEPVDAVDLLRRLLDRVGLRMKKCNVTPFFQSENNPPMMLADPQTIEQVFYNLIGNAIEAMTGKGGTLAVRVRPAEEITTPPQVQITISDTGPGIPDEIRAHMFEPFVTNKPYGTGLGLAITKRIVTAHRGSILHESFPGGTVFHIYIPAYQGE